MSDFWNWIVQTLGIGLRPEQFGFVQIAVRGLLIFLVALVLMRVGHKRSLARKTAFDTAFVVIIGAVLARAINGSGRFFPTIVVACLLVLLHRLLALIAYHWPAFENLIKGRSTELLRDGTPLTGPMHRHDITTGDLQEDLHLCGHRSTDEVALARLERSGDISFVAK